MVHAIIAVAEAVKAVNTQEYLTRHRLNGMIMYTIEWFSPFEKWTPLETVSTKEEADKICAQLDLIPFLNSNLRVVECIN